MRRSGLVFDAIAALLLLIVVCASDRKITGDGQEYVLMVQRLASGHAPAVLVDVAQQAGVYDARLVDRHGRQEMWHFWFFPLCVAPVMVVTSALGWSPVLAFGVVNATLFWVGLAVVRRRVGVIAAVFVGLSPIIWWIDKPQVEVFTFVGILLGCAVLPKLHWSALCFAFAATQNPPIGALVILLGATAIWRRQIRFADALVWALAVGVLTLHPLYYWSELGRGTPLVDANDLRWPAWRTFVTPLIDLNVGLVVNAPVLVAGMLWGLVAVLGSRMERHRAALPIVASLLFLLAFAQAPNVNSGGTPGMSRYALWLIPLAVLVLGQFRLPSTKGAWFAGVAAISAVWSVVFFRPTVAENYLEPTRLATFVWSNYPAAEDPLPEIFAERLRHRDGVNTLASTPNCAKALLQGGVWPDPCEAAIGLPAACKETGALCYANRRTDGTYAYVPTSRRGGINISDLFR